MTSSSRRGTGNRTNTIDGSLRFIRHSDRQHGADLFVDGDVTDGRRLGIQVALAPIVCLIFARSGS